MLKDLTKRFFERLSPVPVAKPLNLRIPSQSERIMALVRHEHRMASLRDEVETFEEADDFEMDDGELWLSPYEEVFDPGPAAPSAPPPAPVAAVPPASPAPLPAPVVPPV